MPSNCSFFADLSKCLESQNQLRSLMKKKKKKIVTILRLPLHSTIFLFVKSDAVGKVC